MSHTYPHMCRMDHEEIGHSSEDEWCPICKLRDALERIKVGASCWNTVEDLEQIAKMAERALEKE